MWFHILSRINNFIWGYIAFAIVIGLGLYFTVRSKTFQLRHFPSIWKHFYNSFSNNSSSEEGTHPIKVLFTAIGGSIGIGNIVGICTAIQIGGPGALFWTWVAGFLGMLLQYSEVFLGMKYRVRNPDGSFDGGPMYFLQKAFIKSKWIHLFVAILLCIYGVELFMFNVITDSISVNWHIPRITVIASILALFFLTVQGGFARITKVCTTIVPIFLIVYIGMCGWILCKNYSILPHTFALIFQGAFTSQGALGGFAGSSILLTISMGLSRGAYAGDLGIGYNSIIHCQTNSKSPNTQALLTMMGIFINTFILCTLSTMLVLLTDTWTQPIDITLMIQSALAQYFPYMTFFMPLFLFLLGYLTIITYYFVGSKCAYFISPRYGKKIYLVYALCISPIFAFVNPTQVFTIMSLAGALLLTINFLGIFRLRKEVQFHVEN
ncbi:MAG: sodium:alanine symporter family protein [Parachlamydiales bacterium]|nr:sodium:alanine symporter family protein [Parachlamydiales bacterium]